LGRPSRQLPAATRTLHVASQSLPPRNNDREDQLRRSRSVGRAKGRWPWWSPGSPPAAWLADQHVGQTPAKAVSRIASGTGRTAGCPARSRGGSTCHGPDPGHAAVEWITARPRPATGRQGHGTRSGGRSRPAPARQGHGAVVGGHARCVVTAANLRPVGRPPRETSVRASCRRTQAAEPAIPGPPADRDAADWSATAAPGCTRPRPWPVGPLPTRNATAETNSKEAPPVPRSPKTFLPAPPGVQRTVLQPMSLRRAHVLSISGELVYDDPDPRPNPRPS
jgi:hypothetical protein